MKVLISLLLLLTISCKPHEKVTYEKGKSLTFSLQGKQTYEIEFKNKKEIPENVHINIASQNSLQQMISFSSTHPNCKNKNKFMVKNASTNSFDILLEKKNFDKKKLYLCIECVSETESCFFDLKMDDSTEKGVKVEDYPDNTELTDFELVKPEMPTRSAPVGEINLMATTTNIDLYVVDSSNADCVSLPSTGYRTTYQISAASGSTFSVSGSTVTCTQGFVMPRNTTWYWYGGLGTTAKPGPGQTPTSIEISYTLGTSTVNVKSGSTITATYVFTVKDYAEIRGEKIMDDYIASKIKSGMTDLEKLEVITAFPAQYPYNASYSGWLSMVSCGGGDCWASTYAILHLAEKVGITAHMRYGANNSGAGSGHRNVAAKIGDEVYIAEAGYSGTTVPRPHSVTKENVGWYYTVSSKKATIKQYDGWLEDLVVPSTIDGYPVVGLGNKAFYWGQSYSGMNVKSVKLPESINTLADSVFNSLKLIKTITIPKNVTSIGNFVFTNCLALTSIAVTSGNTKYISVSGVLYNKDKTKLLYYPTNKTGVYTAPSTLTTVGYYSIYYTNQLTTVKLPKTVTSIEEGAFGTSKVKEIYFSGSQPTFTSNCFYGLNMTAYYASTGTWDTSNIDLYGAKAIKWVKWTPTTSYVQKIKGENIKSDVLSAKNLGAIAAGLVLSLSVVVFLIVKRNKNDALLDNQHTVNVDGLITV